jgi:hypothetical protein
VCTEAFQLGALPHNTTHNLSAARIGTATIATNPNNPFAALVATLNSFVEYCEKETNDKFLSILSGKDVIIRLGECV